MSGSTNQNEAANEQSSLTFDKHTAKSFLMNYKRAQADNKKTFIFQDKKFLVIYAKYLCAYLVMKGLLTEGKQNDTY